MPCARIDGTEMIRWYKNKIIYRGLVPLVPAVPANYTILGQRFFGGRAICDLPIGKLMEDHRGIRWYRRYRQDKVFIDNFISVPLDNSITKQMVQTGQDALLFGRRQ